MIQSCRAFHHTTGVKNNSAVRHISQKVGRRKCTRYGFVHARNSANDGNNATVVYLASMPMPTSAPVSTQGPTRSLSFACQKTVAAASQKKMKMGSIVISRPPITKSGVQAAMINVHHATRGEKIRRVSRYSRHNVPDPRHTLKKRMPRAVSPKIRVPSQIVQATSGPLL